MTSSDRKQSLAARSFTDRLGVALLSPAAGYAAAKRRLPARTNRLSVAEAAPRES